MLSTQLNCAVIKVHVAVDTLGHLLAAVVTPANEQDRTQVGVLAQEEQVALGQRVTLAYADQGYTGEVPAQAAETNGIKLQAVNLGQTKRGFVLLPRRWVVERSLSWSARYKRLPRLRTLGHELTTTPLSGLLYYSPKTGHFSGAC